MWIFYSNLLLQENTAEAKISAKTRRDQPTSRNKVATENRSHDLKIKLATRMTKATSERGCDKGNVVETKGNVQSRIFGRHHTNVMTPIEYN